MGKTFFLFFWEVNGGKLEIITKRMLMLLSSWSCHTTKKNGHLSSHRNKDFSPLFLLLFFFDFFYFLCKLVFVEFFLFIYLLICKLILGEVQDKFYSYRRNSPSSHGRNGPTLKGGRGEKFFTPTTIAESAFSSMTFFRNQLPNSTLDQ